MDIAELLPTIAANPDTTEVGVALIMVAFRARQRNPPRSRRRLAHDRDHVSLRKTRVRFRRFSRWGHRSPVKFSQAVSPFSW
jgi:hypothetical protein